MLLSSSNDTSDLFFRFLTALSMLSIESSDIDFPKERFGLLLFFSVASSKSSLIFGNDVLFLGTPAAGLMDLALAATALRRAFFAFLLSLATSSGVCSGAEQKLLFGSVTLSSQYHFSGRSLTLGMSLHLEQMSHCTQSSTSSFLSPLLFLSSSLSFCRFLILVSPSMRSSLVFGFVCALRLAAFLPRPADFFCEPSSSEMASLSFVSSVITSSVFFVGEIIASELTICDTES
mmetsp:Transcript_15383/g.28980  ORF Transcript_15383/g.28980 Transcript_15383/m.28980 type:complete len:233 (-) Transcript_15383:2168-2866(-)